MFGTILLNPYVCGSIFIILSFISTLIFNASRDFWLRHKIKNIVIDMIKENYGARNIHHNAETEELENSFMITLPSKFFKDYEVDLKYVYFEGRRETSKSMWHGAACHPKTVKIVCSGKISEVIDAHSREEKYCILFSSLQSGIDDTLINYLIMEFEYRQYFKFLKKRKAIKIELNHLDLGKNIIETYLSLNITPI